MFFKPPRALLFATAYLPPDDEAGVTRYRRWLAYYQPVREQFGATAIALIEDGGGGARNVLPAREVDPDTVERLGGSPEPLVVRFPDRLGRPTHTCFPGWWRSFSYAGALAKAWGLSKVIHVESDAFVLSSRMARHIRNIRRGWHVYWCPKWKFPETAIQVIAGRDLDELARIYERGPDFWAKPYGQDREAEFLLPFTAVHKQFAGDRYSDSDQAPPANADYACQVRLGDRVYTGLTSNMV